MTGVITHYLVRFRRFLEELSRFMKSLCRTNRLSGYRESTVPLRGLIFPVTSVSPPQALLAGRNNCLGERVNLPQNGAALELPCEKRDVRLRFATDDYDGPDEVRYRTKLEGLNADWTSFMEEPIWQSGP